jgi:3-phenylpropionate/trans-cinnamate dioxygenase ferredoxin subunit
MFNYKVAGDVKIEYVEVAEASELPNGERLFLEIDRRPIVVINLGGVLYAIGDVCSHDDGPVGDGEIEGMEIICPRHGARFDLRTGEVLLLPAVVDIPAYPVRVVDGKIEIGIPVE